MFHHPWSYLVVVLSQPLACKVTPQQLKQTCEITPGPFLKVAPLNAQNSKKKKRPPKLANQSCPCEKLKTPFSFQEEEALGLSCHVVAVGNAQNHVRPTAPAPVHLIAHVANFEGNFTWHKHVICLYRWGERVFFWFIPPNVGKLEVARAELIKRVYFISFDTKIHLCFFMWLRFIRIVLKKPVANCWLS